jgi:uncharacterized protein (TIGR04255 family)
MGAVVAMSEVKNGIDVSFDSPPVVEVLAGVQLTGLGAEGQALLAAFWKDRLRSDFPHVEVQPPYVPTREAGALIPSFLMPERFPHSRLWVSSEDQQELLQLQPEWFACNWRRVRPNDEYDRWTNRRASFSRHFSALLAYFADAGVTVPIASHCEVTYINHFQAEHQEAKRFLAGDVFQTVPLALERMAVEASFEISSAGTRIGVLHLRFLPALAKDGRTSLYALELTARGAPLGPGINGVLAFLDAGRKAIDRTFVDVTSQSMHEVWGMR